MISKGRKKLDPKQEHEKRVVLETIVSLLPRERNVLSVSFLAMLLRSSTWLETTVACRLDLEKRMALQLGQAALDDLLIPSYCITGDTLFDVDSVRRILMNYLESEVEGNHLGYGVGEEHVSPSNDLERVGKLMENYLAEIASDRNLTVSKFIGLVELIPEQARVTEDGIYRAIDIFLKAHPTLSDLERKKVCSIMDCQKLSREACAHAAQNDRLPVQTVVQVLYHEQQRLRDNMNETNGGESNSSTGAIVPSKTLNLYPTSTPSTEELLKLRRENEDLKIELLKLNMRLKEVDKRMNLIDNANNYNNNNINTSTSATNSPANSFAPSVTAGAADGDQKPPLPRKSFMNSVKKLGRLLLLADGVLTPSTRRTKSNKGRRHSIS
ncbi:BTB/POZ domain-containing protein SR1IP1 [Bienertia sinuspersici]